MWGCRCCVTFFKRFSDPEAPGSFVTFYVNWKFLAISLMVEMGVFTALALLLKPLH